MESRYPILQSLINAGHVTILGYVFVGHASDGTECILPGSEVRPDQTEAYLANFPTPDMW